MPGAGDAQPQQVGDGVLSEGQVAASAQTGPWEQGWGTAWSVVSRQQAWVGGTNLRPGVCSPSCCRTPRLPLEGGLGLWSHRPQVHYSWLLPPGWLVVRLGGGCPPTCGCGKTQVLRGRASASSLRESVGYGPALLHSLLCTAKLSVTCPQKPLCGLCG